MLRILFGLIALFGLASSVAVAGEAGAEATEIDASLTGSYHVTGRSLSRLRVDMNGDGQAGRLTTDSNGDGKLDKERYGQKSLVTHRLRFEPQVTFDKALTFQADLQLATGFLSVNPPADRFVPHGAPRGEDYRAGESLEDQIKLRKLYLTWKTPVGAFIAGRLASSWGMGILANGGDDEDQDWGTALMGVDRNYGDVVNRVIFVTPPLIFASNARWAKRWMLALGADVVERDERLSRSEGDLAREGIGALRYSHKGREGGLYVAYRDLKDRNDDTMKVWAFDLYAKADQRIDDFELYGVGEVVAVRGETTLARNNAVTGQIDIAQLGYVARAGATYLPFSIGADLELGYASGDSNPNDGSLRNFTFDPDYNPSLILFEELRAAETVATAANASDPARVAVPPDAARLVPTNGSVSNAIYLRPTVRYRWQDLKVRLAALWAWAEEDVVDPFNLNAFSAPNNYQGGLASDRNLGVEVNLGVDYGYTVEDWVRVDASLQAGRFFPGTAFKNGNGSRHPPITVLFARVGLRWLPPPAASEAHNLR